MRGDSTRIGAVGRPVRLGCPRAVGVLVDVFPAYEVTVAVITFVLGFVSARHHAQLNSARQLVAEVGETVGSGRSSRDVISDLLELARTGFQRDRVVDATIAAAVVVSVGLTILLVVGVDLGWLGESTTGVVKGVIAVLLLWLVTGLGAADASTVHRRIDALRSSTTVGLLCDAEAALASRAWQRAVSLATLAESRAPGTALAPLARARARVEALEARAGRSHDEEALQSINRDVERALDLDEGLVAGMLDWLVPAGTTDLPASILERFGRGVRTDALLRQQLRRRIASHSHGAVRRAVLGDRSTEGQHTAAELVSRIGSGLITERGVEALSASRRGDVDAARLLARDILSDTSSPLVDVLAAANISLAAGDLNEADPLARVGSIPDRWQPWYSLTRADWLEARGDTEGARAQLRGTASPLHRLRLSLLESHVQTPTGSRGAQ